MRITFTPLQESHFLLLLQWLEAPHVKAWWDQNIEWTPELIKKKYGPYVQGFKRLALPDRVIEKPMHAFIVCVNEQEIGYIQYYNAYDFPREQRYEIEGLPQSMASLDVFIGGKEAIGKGWGTRILTQFIEEHIFKDFDACFVDPDTANIQAIRAYESAGFKKVKTIQKGTITWMIKMKEETNSVRNKVYKLELSLLSSETRHSVKELENLLADDFIEIGSSGRVYNKKDMLKWLPLETPRKFVIEDFSILSLLEEVVLATYKLTSETRSFMRSSMWKFNGDKWQMIFHQGTNCER